MIYSSIALSSIGDFLWIITAALIFSWVFRKIRLPPILGAILAGLVLGPSWLNIIHLNENPLAYQWLIFLGTMGGLILVFLVGLESNLKEILSFSREGLTVGFSGMLLSFVIVAGFARFMGVGTIQSLLLGVAMAISSTIPSLTTIVSLRKGNTRAAKIFSVSSLVDDVFGLLLLFLVINTFSASGVNLVGLAEFLGLLAIFWVVSLTIIPRISVWAYNYFDYPSEQTTSLLTFIFILIAAIAAEDFFYEASFGVFLVGLAFSTLHPLYKYEIKKVFLSLGDMLLFPAFFVMIGLNVDLHVFSSSYWALFAIGIVIAAIIGKVLAGLIGAWFTRLSTSEGLAVGLSLIPRGGVSLVIASLALSKQLISPSLFSSIVLVVIVTILLAPVFSRIGFSRVESKTTN
uniref:Kef-type K+ transport system membrane component n=1 Tax=uncultured euryarchaeote Alv-FOS5 TaxID=337891 RepID=Q3SBA1_9EURY|nr:Kef-type K+ transport system membrane component [uncultured euryarchaeote Alv-FOS5]